MYVHTHTHTHNGILCYELSLDFIVARATFSEEDTSVYFKSRILLFVIIVCVSYKSIVEKIME